MVAENQLRHIEAHQAEFNETYGDGETRNVREYFLHEYADDPDLYASVCSDLGIKPLEPELTPEIFYAAVAQQEHDAIAAASSPMFRALMGDETADGVIELARESLAKIPEQYRVKEETT